jgi:RHS repeat-associated protein
LLNFARISVAASFVSVRKGPQHASPFRKDKDIACFRCRIQTVLPDGRVVNKLFYGSGHLHRINLDGEVISDIERDAIHRAISRSQGALTTRLSYDPVGRLLSQVAGDGAAPVIARNYEYDRAGNLILIDDSRNGRTTYNYDAIGGILAAVQPNLDERFAFDPAHNLLDQTVGNGGRVEANRVRVFEDKRFNYDSHGNLSEKLAGRHTRMQFEWNAAHQMVKSTVTRNAQQDQPAVQTVKYSYDPFGRRIAKRDAFGTTRFAWDGNRLLCETRGSQCRTYVYESGWFVPLAQVDSKQHVESANCLPRAQVRYLHTDHLGTPREMTDSDGRVTWAATYKAWGNVLRIEQPEPPTQVVTSALHDLSQEALAQAQPIRFQGQYQDAETGLYYNRLRYYDADIGRFISQDPIGLPGGSNTYQYAPNPVTWIDPSGLSGTPIVAIGEGQAAVDEATRLLRLQGYSAESMMFPRNQWRGGDLEGISQTDFEKAVQWNKKWLAEKIRQEYPVVDVGPDGRSPPSRFYLAELKAIKEAKVPKTTLKKFENGETVAEMRGRLCPC